MPNRPTVDIDRLWQRIQTLSTFTRKDIPWTRRAFSLEAVKAREWLLAEFAAAGMDMRIDAGGNLIGQRQGSDPTRMPLLIGSHSDTVTGGGRFDGILGVLAGLEVAHSLHDAGHVMHHPLQIIDFLSEEPSDYGISCVGSRAYTGNLDSKMLTAKNGAGETLADGIRRMGGKPEALHLDHCGSGDVAGYLELHIEQGPVLEAESIPIGVVSNIVGIRRYEIVVRGQPDHAGTTPMNIRRDALVGAARLILEVEHRANTLGEGSDYVVATVGKLALTPNAANAVPGCVTMTLEVRSDCPKVLNEFPEMLLMSCRKELERLRVSATLSLLTSTRPTNCTPRIMDAIERASKRLNLSHRRMPSGAGHDAMYFAGMGPMGMIFVPCLGGRSHCPEEWISKGQAANGAGVLMETILELDNWI